MEFTIGNRIRKLREFRNFTQEYMALKLNISVTAYGDIERDKVAVNVKRVQEIARILDIHYSHLEDEHYLDQFLQTPVATFQSVQAVSPQGGQVPEEGYHTLLEAVKMVQKEQAKIVGLLNKQLNNGQRKLYVSLLFLIQSFHPELLLPFLPELG